MWGRVASAVISAFVLATSLPAVARGATITASVRVEDGTTFGEVRYRSGSGVANRLTVRAGGIGAVFADRAEPLHASGACERVDRNTATCPRPEGGEGTEIVVGSQADRVDVRGTRGDVTVRGGGGDDVLVGTGVGLFGDRGDDRLRGGAGFDRLHGGPGRDRMEVSGAVSGLSDHVYDGETDAQAAPDVVVAGAGGALLHYSERRRPLRLDLRSTRFGPEGDRVTGASGAVGGRGDDVLVGTGGANSLDGGPGDDRIEGRGGRDIVAGGAGDDRLSGGDGNDDLRERYDSPGGGADRFTGGRGRDEVDAVEREDEDAGPDDVRCDAADAPVRTAPADRVRGCAQVIGWDDQLLVDVQPELAEDRAVFTLRCGFTEIEQTPGGAQIVRCRGRLALRRADGGDLGSAGFLVPGSFGLTPPFTVAVPLTAAGRAAIRAGEVVAVVAEPVAPQNPNLPVAGYRTRLGT